MEERKGGSSITLPSLSSVHMRCRRCKWSRGALWSAAGSWGRRKKWRTAVWKGRADPGREICCSEDSPGSLWSELTRSCFAERSFTHGDTAGPFEGQRLRERGKLNVVAGFVMEKGSQKVQWMLFNKWGDSCREIWRKKQVLVLLKWILTIMNEFFIHKYSDLCLSEPLREQNQHICFHSDAPSISGSWQTLQVWLNLPVCSCFIQWKRRAIKALCSTFSSGKKLTFLGGGGWRKGAWGGGGGFSMHCTVFNSPFEIIHSDEERSLGFEVYLIRLLSPLKYPIHLKLLIAFLLLNPVLIGLSWPHIRVFIWRWETVLPRLEIK